MPALRREPIQATPVKAISVRYGPAPRFRPVRTGVPFQQPYVYGAPRPAWAVRAIAAAEDEHGLPPAPRLGRPPRGGE